MIDDTEIVNDNQQTPRIENRANDTRVDDTDTSQLTVTLHTIDNAILKHIADKIKPTITQNGIQVPVPIIYGDPERWKSAQRDGVLRDSIGKIQLPMIMVRRTDMTKAPSNSAVNKYLDRTFHTGWNRRTPYDRFAVTNKIVPSREYYNTTAVPDYYQFTYRCVVWTEYMEQMNSIVEAISFETDEFWGNPNGYKFRAAVKSYNTTTQLPNNADRVVRTTFDISVFGYLLPDSMLDAGGNRSRLTRKRYGIKKIVTFTEIDD